MGQEIPSSRFGDADFAEFRHRLEMETRLLAEWFETDVFSSPNALGGFELEACLLDTAANPAPHNQRLLEDFNDPLVVPELATFNVEFNSRVHRMQGSVFSHMTEELRARWKRVNERAAQLDLRMGMIGVLPTLKLSALTLANMSPLNRYRALNEQVFRLRNGKPVTLDIDGRESLHLSHDDVMLESAATSFQIHLQVNGAQAADLYNPSKIVSAPMVGVSANSPFLLGRDLWDETRIPLFE
ncbi:MAG: hypothetical protein KZQ65_12400 [Candidatus Thiodiazotropha sp. (ex Gloverina cf. vestifex)]|nr:hypothetical protein [Candidatus Thiodiazotropha sp. (ex Gloverina cf. vestifex)]